MERLILNCLLTAIVIIILIYTRYGYGNWKDIASHVENKTPEQSKEEYIRQYIYGSVGKHTWREELRGFAVDHTQAADRGPLSPTLTSKLPPISVSSQEAVLVIITFS
jgi:transcriptional adapter 2-beta